MANANSYLFQEQNLSSIMTMNAGREGMKKSNHPDGETPDMAGVMSYALTHQNGMEGMADMPYGHHQMKTDHSMGTSGHGHSQKGEMSITRPAMNAGTHGSSQGFRG